MSSIGAILKSCGYHLTSIKIDPYLNVDAGTMSPFEHGEVYVLHDGSEVDLDLGNYERYLNIRLHSDHNITTGKIYQRVIEAERKGDYLGKTVQVVPHVTNAIMVRPSDPRVGSKIQPRLESIPPSPPNELTSVSSRWVELLVTLSQVPTSRPSDNSC